MQREFGFDRVVFMNEINTKLGTQQSGEILKFEFNDISDEETSMVTNTETEFEAPPDDKFVSNCQLPVGFEEYLQTSSDDFILKCVPPQV